MGRAAAAVRLWRPPAAPRLATAPETVALSGRVADRPAASLGPRRLGLRFPCGQQCDWAARGLPRPGHSCCPALGPAPLRPVPLPRGSDARDGTLALGLAAGWLAVPTRLKGRWVAGKRLPRPVTWPEAEPQGPVLPDEAAGRPGLRAGQLHRAAGAEAAVLARGQGPWGARCRTRRSPLAALDVAPGPDPRCCAWPGHSGLGPRLAAAACVGQPEVRWGIVSPDWPTLAWRSCPRVVGAGRPHWAARGALQRFSQMDQLPTSLCSGVLRARVELEPWDGPLLVHRGPWPWGGGFRVPPTARSEAGGQPEAVPCWLLCPCIYPGSGTQPGGPGNTQAPVLTPAPTASLPSPQAPEPRRGAAGCGWGTQVSGSHVRATNCQRFGLSQTSCVCPESWCVCCPQVRLLPAGPKALGGSSRVSVPRKQQGGGRRARPAAGGRGSAPVGFSRQPGPCCCGRLATSGAAGPSEEWEVP